MNAKPCPQKETSPKPIEIKRGNVSVKIYQVTNRVKNRKTGEIVCYPQFTLTYYIGNARVKKKFSDLDVAKREAEIAATKLANGENEVLKLTSSDRANYIQSCQLLEPLGVSLYRAVETYVRIVKALPEGTNPEEAVAFFVRRNPAVLPKKTVQEVVREMIDTKAKAGRSDLHVKDMETRLGRFAADLQMPISQVTGDLIQKHLDGLGTAGRTRLNHLRQITALFRFSVKRRYLSKDALEEIEAVEKPEVLPTPTLIFTPAELREMLSSVREELRPWLAIAAFCGLRTAEILRLDWAQVNLERRFVEVKALNAKTAARRLVPICDAAVAWIAPTKQAEGRLATYVEENKFVDAILLDVKRARKAALEQAVKDGDTVTAAKLRALPAFAWKRNGLRHSFCSYRLAVTNDAAKTALEAGNSPAMIFRHYRELVTPEEAAEWFAIIPPQDSNIVQMPVCEQAAIV